MRTLENDVANIPRNGWISVKAGMQAFGFDGAYVGVVRGFAGGRLYVTADDGAVLCLPRQQARTGCGSFVLLGGTARELRAAHVTGMVRRAQPAS